MVGRSDIWTSTTWLKFLCNSLSMAWLEFLGLFGVEVGVGMQSPPPPNPPHVPPPLFLLSNQVGGVGWM